MRDLFSEARAYTHNGDDQLMRSLGLNTGPYPHGEEFLLGTVVTQEAATENEYDSLTGPCPETKVECYVTALPAMFFRFVIHRPLDKVVDDPAAPRGWRSVYEPVEIIEMNTGSGGFGEYWRTAKQIADHMVSVKTLDSPEGDGKL